MFKMHIAIKPSHPPVTSLFHRNECTNDAWWHMMITVVYVIARKANKHKKPKRGTRNVKYNSSVLCNTKQLM